MYTAVTVNDEYNDPSVTEYFPGTFNISTQYHHALRLIIYVHNIKLYILFVFHPHLSYIAEATLAMRSVCLYN